RLRHPRPQRARSTGDQRADGLLLSPLLRATHVQQRLRVSLPPPWTGGDAHGDLVSGSLSRRTAGGETHPSGGVGVRRPAMATHTRAGLLKPAQAATGPAREGLRVHEALEA